MSDSGKMNTATNLLTGHQTLHVQRGKCRCKRLQVRLDLRLEVGGTVGELISRETRERFRVGLRHSPAAVSGEDSGGVCG